MKDSIFFPDFKDFISALNQAKVKYLLVGGYSVILHGYSRATMDMDIWVEKSADNYEKIKQAFEIFKMPTLDMTEENFLNNDDFDVFTYGRKPVSIDLINQLKGLEFSVAWENKSIVQSDEIEINLISKPDLITAKKAAGRHKDLDDLEHLDS